MHNVYSLLIRIVIFLFFCSFLVSYLNQRVRAGIAEYRNFSQCYDSYHLLISHAQRQYPSSYIIIIFFLLFISRQAFSFFSVLFQLNRNIHLSDLFQYTCLRKKKQLATIVRSLSRQLVISNWSRSYKRSLRYD